MKIKRYALFNHDHKFSEMQELETGGWVRWEDVEGKAMNKKIIRDALVTGRTFDMSLKGYVQYDAALAELDKPDEAEELAEIGTRNYLTAIQALEAEKAHADALAEALQEAEMSLISVENLIPNLTFPDQLKKIASALAAYREGKPARDHFREGKEKV